MALPVNQIRVSCGISIRSVLAVEFRIFQRQASSAVGAFTLLLSPFQGFKFFATTGLTSLIVGEFLCYFSPICEQ